MTPKWGRIGLFSYESNHTHYRRAHKIHINLKGKTRDFPYLLTSEGLLMAKCPGPQGLRISSAIRDGYPGAAVFLSQSSDSAMPPPPGRIDHRGLEVPFSAYPLINSLGTPASLTAPVPNMHNSVGVCVAQTLSGTYWSAVPAGAPGSRS